MRFLKCCLCENNSDGYSFCDEAFHYASCREDLRDPGFMPFRVTHSHGNREQGWKP